MNTLTDAFGRVPNDYDGPGTTVTRFTEQHRAGGASVTPVIEAVDIHADATVVSSLSSRAGLSPSYPYDQNDDGGWGTGHHEVRSQEKDPQRCDLAEYQVSDTLAREWRTSIDYSPGPRTAPCGVPPTVNCACVRVLPGFAVARGAAVNHTVQPASNFSGCCFELDYARGRLGVRARRTKHWLRQRR